MTLTAKLYGPENQTSYSRQETNFIKRMWTTARTCGQQELTYALFFPKAMEKEE
jgi:hypothetical protein